MFDEPMRRLKDRLFQPVAQLLLWLSPWWLSLLGLLAGLAAAVVLWQQMYLAGLLLWVLNRVLDGLDGAVARLRGTPSDLGGYLDIVIDYVVYAAIPVGLAMGVSAAAVDPTAVIYSLIFLLCTYYVNAASWMYLAAILEKRRQGYDGRLTSITMPTGLIGGTETIIFYTAFILFPAYLVWLFGLMGLLIIVTILQRGVWAVRHLA